MRLIHDLKDANLTEESVITIGSFDGLHRGHQALIADVRESAGAPLGGAGKVRHATRLLGTGARRHLTP